MCLYEKNSQKLSILAAQIKYVKLLLKFKPDDNNLIVGMSDGLISIKDRKKHDKTLEEMKELASKKLKNTFNPYKYVSPTLVKSSPVNT